jgi:hypothetical protein
MTKADRQNDTGRQALAASDAQAASRFQKKEEQGRAWLKARRSPATLPKAAFRDDDERIHF